MGTNGSLLRNGRLQVTAPVAIRAAAEPGAAQAARDDAAWRSVLSWLAPALAERLQKVPPALSVQVEEIRLRAARPLQLVLASGDRFLRTDGSLTTDPAAAEPVPAELVDVTWQAACAASVYRFEEQVRQGFLTLPGGHRVGVAGHVLHERGRILRQRDIASLNVRLARAHHGCAAALVPQLWDREAALPHHTLIVAPPGAGKTTLLRDVVRLLSWGDPARQRPGVRVALIDEREEIAACERGVPTLDVGPRTDVLAGCPKAAGMLMALRALNPQVIAFDELAGPEDVACAREAANAGVRVLATAHGNAARDLLRRPGLEGLWRAPLFTRVVELARAPRPGFIRRVGPPPALPAPNAPSDPDPSHRIRLENGGTRA